MYKNSGEIHSYMYNTRSKVFCKVLKILRISGLEFRILLWYNYIDINVYLIKLKKKTIKAVPFELSGKYLIYEIVIALSKH